MTSVASIKKKDKTEVGLFGAMAAARSKIQKVRKTADNPYFHSKYADINSVLNSILSPLEEEGLSVFQPLTTNADGTMGLKTIVYHSSGEKFEETVPLTSKSPNPQDFGSAITYFRRYALISLFCLETTDDDGNGDTSWQKEKQNEKPIVRRNQAEESPPPIDESDIGPASTFDMATVMSHADGRMTGEVDITFGDFEFKFGKFKGRKLIELDTTDVKNYFTWLVKSKKDKGQEYKDDYALKRISKYLKITDW